ncbi:MAG: MTAP family purine nucleoside phosphorylase [Proteobacteria bacterium]|nr:MTAP family purine nucleoside phosphorylase [Pseudomonadota bacterium]MCP4921104.1 MTAP family purine nucleoside phosphorylase [Pseudomonadota bacterium]
MSKAVVLGSAFHDQGPRGREVVVHTRFGLARIHEHADGFVLYRHGLPHQIPWRANAVALAQLGVTRLLVTSPVGVLDPAVPLDRLLLVEDVLWPDMRLPSGGVCTVFDEGGGHLVLEDGLVSTALNS